MKLLVLIVIMAVMAIMLIAAGCSGAEPASVQSGGEEAMLQEQGQEHVHEHEPGQNQQQEQEQALPAAYTLSGSVNEQYELIIESNLTLSKENYNKSHQEGEGHVHLYVNGKLIGPIQDLEPYSLKPLLKSGENTIKLVLASNNHNESIYKVSYVLDVLYEDSST